MCTQSCEVKGHRQASVSRVILFPMSSKSAPSVFVSIRRPYTPSTPLFLRDQRTRHYACNIELVFARRPALGMVSALYALRRALMAPMSHAFVPSPVLLRRSTFIATRPVSAALSPRAPSVSHVRSLSARVPLGQFSTVAVDAVESDKFPTAVASPPAPHDADELPVVSFSDFDEASVSDNGALKPAPTRDVPKVEQVQAKKAETKDESPHGLGAPVSSYRVSPVTVEALAKNNITHVTDVQAGTFDVVYDGKDLIAKSRTGTGKTLAFALPILERLAIIRKQEGLRPRGKGPGCLVLAPTRELAKQVSREMAYIGKGLGLSVECVYGGSSYGPQESALRRGVDVIVGTPGRIMDHLDRGTLVLNNISFAVLDEADEMLSMGFAEDVEHVFKTLPPVHQRQVILFSATVPSWVKRLAAQYQKPDVKVFDSVTTGTQAATTVRHCAVRVPERDDSRASLLADIIAVHSRTSGDSRVGDVPSRAIVFTQTKKEADELVACGILDGCGAAVLHGDVSQRQRETTLAQFRKGRFQVLVATDVAARGLDISGVDVVVQYRVPRDSDAYIHRAGRTGRAGKSGTAVVLYSDRELRSLRSLENECRIKFHRESAPAPEAALDAAVEFALQSARTVDPRILKHLESVAQRILEAPEDATATLAGILAVAGRRTKLEDRSVLSGEIGMRTFQIKGNQEVTPALALRTLSLLAEDGNPNFRVGLIRICVDGSAVVDVPSEAASKILEASGEGTPLTITAATEIPPLREADRGGNRNRGDRRQGGRVFSRGRDSYSRDRGNRGGNRRDRYSSRDSFSRSDRGDRYGGRGRYGDSRGGGYRRDDTYGGSRDSDYGGNNRRQSSMLHDDF